MLPGNSTFSTPAVVTGSVDPVKQPGDFLIDYERGGIALNDATQGLMVQIWKLEAIRNEQVTDNWDIFVSAPSVGTVHLFTTSGVTEVALAFDQNMRPFVVYVADGITRMWWYDPTIPGQTITTLGSGYRSPRCFTDEKRPWHTDVSDIQLWYVRGSNLCQRLQRERFAIEHVEKMVGPEAELVSVTMATNNRVRWRLRKSTLASQDGQVLIQGYPYLSDIVSDLCVRAGISQEALDVNDLYSDNVVGYLIASTDGIYRSLQPLSEAFFFDPAAYDRKLHFLKRGREVSFSFTFDDLAEPMKEKRGDETKLPIRVDVNHVDPDGAFARNKQSAYRKSNLIKAKGNTKLEFGFSMTADQAATVALKTIKRDWHEPMEYTWALPLAFTYITEGDVGLYTDEDGNVIRIRVTQRDESDWLLKFQGRQDGGPEVYNRGAKGLPLKEPISTTPGLVGETRIEILNLPPLRDQDDELGVYIAMAGDSSAWYGASLEISTDGGANYVEAFQNEIPATLGDTETELLAEVDPNYPSNQTLVVKTNFQLESVTRDTLYTNYNRAVLGDEVIQFQTALHLGDNRYLLSGLIRGRYNTKSEAWPAGTRFVLIDTSLVFQQAQQWMLGKDILFKPVSFGSNGEEAVPTEYEYDVAYSQYEWAPTMVTTRRDGSDSVLVNWVGRGRLGVESAPYNGKYFSGYKVKFSDGFEAVTGPSDQSYTRASTPAGVSVQICGLNSLTGDGEYSEAILT